MSRKEYKLPARVTSTSTSSGSGSGTSTSTSTSTSSSSSLGSSTRTSITASRASKVLTPGQFADKLAEIICQAGQSKDALSYLTRLLTYPQIRTRQVLDSTYRLLSVHRRVNASSESDSCMLTDTSIPGLVTLGFDPTLVYDLLFNLVLYNEDGANSEMIRLLVPYLSKSDIAKLVGTALRWLMQINVLAVSRQQNRSGAGVGVGTGTGEGKDESELESEPINESTNILINTSPQTLDRGITNSLHSLVLAPDDTPYKDVRTMLVSYALTISERIKLNDDLEFLGEYQEGGEGYGSSSDSGSGSSSGDEYESGDVSGDGEGDEEIMSEED
jgi:hypothetical protein